MAEFSSGVRRLLVSCLLGLTSSSGCAEDAHEGNDTEATDASSTETETTGDICNPPAPTKDCRAGMLGCVCTADCECDPRLVCSDGECINQAPPVEPECGVGAYCPCSAGLCSAGLECVEDTCLPAGVTGGAWLSDCFSETKFSKCDAACNSFGATCSATACNSESFVSYSDAQDCSIYRAVFSGYGNCGDPLNFGQGTMGRCCCVFE